MCLPPAWSEEAMMLGDWDQRANQWNELSSTESGWLRTQLPSGARFSFSFFFGGEGFLLNSTNQKRMPFVPMSTWHLRKHIHLIVCCSCVG